MQKKPSPDRWQTSKTRKFRLLLPWYGLGGNRQPRPAVAATMGIHRRLILAGFLAAVVVGAAWGLVPTDRPFASSESQAIRLTLPVSYIEDIETRPRADPPSEREERVIVDTVVPGDAYALESWSAERTAVGWFDSLTRKNAASPPGSTLPLEPNDIVVAQGWVGDGTLGMRFPYVLLTTCGVVVATVTVDRERPDVAKAVHPHLTRSGWQATLLAGDLPRCGSMTLQAYGVAPARRLIFPLSGEFQLALLDGEAPHSSQVEHRGVLIGPEDIPLAPRSTVLSVKPSRLELRQCGDSKCSVVGSLPIGEHAVSVLDRSPGWVLIFSERGAGWVSSHLAQDSDTVR